jgi:hypothetical protein
MPHREAAMMGLPVITQAFSGMDDGHTHEWSIVLQKGKYARDRRHGQHIAGEWMVADIDELAQAMRACYDEPAATFKRATYARRWLRKNQTWEISCRKLLDLMVSEGVFLQSEHNQALAQLGAHNQRWIEEQHANDEHLVKAFS